MEKCEKGYHYHPEHPKAGANGCMKDEDMKEGSNAMEGKRENFGGTFSIYNAVRCSGVRRLNDPTSYIGV
jgi:hypothetical protein